MKTNDETYNYINFPNKNKEFEFDEDTYEIEFTFSGNDMKNYKIKLNANYQNDDYIELYEITEDGTLMLSNRFTNDGMDSLWEHLYEKHTQPILIGICELVKEFMQLRNK